MMSKRRRRGLYSTRGAGSIVSILINLARVFVPLLTIAAIAYFVLNLHSSGSGRLKVKTNIPGADILIGGIQTGLKSDTTIKKLAPGRKIISVRKQDYVSEPEFAIVPIADDSITSVSFRLTPAHQSMLRSDSIPPLRAVRQEIFADGEPYVSVPPGPSRDKPLVDYSRRPSNRPSTREYVEPQSSDYSAQQTPVPTESVDPNSLEDIPADGQGAPEGIVATEVLLSSAPEGAKIWVNGSLTERATPYTFRGLDGGMYVFKAELEGMIASPESVIVELTESYQRELVSFNLIPDPSLPKPTIAIRTTPLAAEIRINGANAGVGQVTKELPYGSYQIEFAEAPGFRSPEMMVIDLTKDQPHVELTGEYEKIIGNCFLAIMPSEEVEKFDPKLLRVYVDNELVLDGPDGKFNATLVSKIVSGNRLIKVHYGELQNDAHLEMLDGAVTEITFRVDSFFGKRSLKIKEKSAIPLDKWQERSRRLTVLNLG